MLKQCRKKKTSKPESTTMKQNGAMTIAVQVVLIGLFTLKVYLVQKVAVSSGKLCREVGCQTVPADESPTSWCFLPSRDSSTATLSLTEDEDDDRQVPKLTFSISAFAGGEELSDQEYSDLSSCNSESDRVSASFGSDSSGVSDGDSDSDVDNLSAAGISKKSGLPDDFFADSPLALLLNKCLHDEESEGK